MKRGTQQLPLQVVNLRSNHPCNAWKMGRIIELQKSHCRVVREAQVKLQNGHIIRRSVNLLILLEVGDTYPNLLPRSHIQRQVATNVYSIQPTHDDRINEPQIQSNERQHTSTAFCAVNTFIAQYLKCTLSLVRLTLLIALLGYSGCYVFIAHDCTMNRVNITQIDCTLVIPCNTHLETTT